MVAYKIWNALQQNIISLTHIIRVLEKISVFLRVVLLAVAPLHIEEGVSVGKFYINAGV